MENKLLTVVIPAYNAGKYLKETLESVFNQKTSFEFDVFVSDDHSIDSTEDICKDYKHKYKNFDFFRHQKNIGEGRPNANLYFVANYPKTKYIAFIDSDDIYLTTDFLESQVKILEENPNVTKVFTNVKEFQENGDMKIKFNKTNKPPQFFDLHHFFINNSVGICQSSTVMRRNSDIEIPPFFKDYFQCDWLLHIYCGLQGEFAYNDIVGVGYRIHSNNATHSSKQERILIDGINLVYRIKKYLPKDFHLYFNHPVNEMNRLAFFYLRKLKMISFGYWYLKWIRLTPSKNWKIRDQFWYFRQAILRN